MEIEINKQDFMKFMTSSQKVFLPKNPEEITKFMQRYDGSCVVINDLKEGFLIGRLTIKNHVNYSLRIDDKEKQLSFSTLQEFYLPKLC